MSPRQSSRLVVKVSRSSAAPREGGGLLLRVVVLGLDLLLLLLNDRLDWSTAG